MITSTTNPKIKYIRRLLNDRRFRERERAYVVEGRRWLAELARLATPPQLVLAVESWLAEEENRRLVEELNISAQPVSEAVMNQASDTETPAGVLAVVPMIPRPLPAGPALLLILDRIANPGNLGTMLRTAAAAGADGVILGPGCVDAYNPKVVRGGMGAHLRLPLLPAGWPEIAELTAGMAVWLAAAGGPLAYYDVDWRQPSALIIGGEAAGASAPAYQLAGSTVSIPMQAETESLNAAVAAGIILFEAVRQRTEMGRR